MRSWRGFAALALVVALGLFALRSAGRSPRSSGSPPAGAAPAHDTAEPSTAMPAPPVPALPVTVLPLTVEPPAREPSDPARNAERAARVRSPQLLVTVVDPGRVPLGGVRVRAFVGPEPAGEARTDGRGCAALALPEDGAPLVLLAEREGFVHVRRKLASDTSAVLVLRPAAVLTGRVLEAETKLPIPGVVVEHAHLGCSGCALERALTDASGRYELVVASGSAVELLSFTLRAAGFHCASLTFVAREPGAALTRDFELVRRRSEVHGRVVDLVTGAPLSDARLSLELDVLGTEADGSFSSTRTVRLDLPPARESDSNRLVVRAPGHARVSIPTSEEWPVLVPLPPVASLVGRVSDPEGRPLRAQVVLGTEEEWDASETPLASLPPHWTVRGVGHEATTDAGGRYRIDGLLPWRRDHGLWVAADGYAPLELHEIVPALPGQELVLDVTLRSRGTAAVHGAFRFNGRPASGAVTWQCGERQSGRAEAEDGRYRLEGLPEGEIRLTAQPGERAIHGFVPAARTAVTLVAGQELQHDFALELVIADIAGRVSHADGAPVARLELRARMESDAWFDTVRADEHGRYRLRVPDCGVTYELSLQDGGLRQTRAGVAPGAQDVDFVLPAMGRLLCRAVERGSGRAVRPSWSWRIAGLGEYEALVVRGADAQGFHEVRLPLGQVDLHANGAFAGFRSETRLDLAVRAEGEPERVTFELEPGLTLALQLVPPEPPPEACIVLPPEELWADLACTRNALGNNTLSFGGRHPGTSLAGLFFDDEGRVRLRGLAPGRYRFKAFHEPLTFEPEVIEVRAPEPGTEPAPVRVRWSR